ncbi:MAG: PRC-barrel domain-containing protein [Ferrovibrio sp.]
MRIPIIIAALLLAAGTAAAQAPKQEEPGTRQPRAAAPGPNAVPGIPDGEKKSKQLDFSVEEHMPELSSYQMPAIGAKLRNEAGDTLGTIENVIVDRKGQVIALVVGVDKLLGLAEDRVEIDWAQVRVEHHDTTAAFVTPLSKADLRDLAKFTEPKRRPS